MAGSRAEKVGDPVEEKGQAEQDEKDDDEDENGGHASAAAGLPVVAEDVGRRRFRAALEFGASVPGITPTDTQKEIDSEGFIVRHLVRSSLSAVQTPQCFDFARLLEAHTRAAKDAYEYTDDTEIWGAYCGRVRLFPGDVNNIKITYPSDLEILKQVQDDRGHL